MQDRPLEKFVNDDNKWNEIVDVFDILKYEQAVSEYKKFRTLIKTMVVRNITFLSEKEYDHVWTEYGEIINASDISNGDDVIADVWNEYGTKQVIGKKHGKQQNSFLTDDSIKLINPKNISRSLKEDFQNHKRKHNVSLTLYHEKYTKKLEVFLLIKNQNI